MTIAITLGDRQELLLSRIDRLALDIAIRSFRQQVCDASELAVTLIDLVDLVSCDNKERNAVSYLRGPLVVLVET